MVKSNSYNEDNIQRHAGLSGIRAKPTVYVGPVDSDGLFTILREPLDNTADLSLKGMNDSVHAIMDGTGYWIIDNGPGFPVGKKEFLDERGRKEKLSTFYVATGLTHAGSNFDSDKISRGTHGLGGKCTNALSNVYKVWTFRDSNWYCIEYKKGNLHKDVYKTKAPRLPFGFKAKKGSVVYFEPDLTIFSKGSKLNTEDVVQWCKLTSILVPKFEVKLTDHKKKTRVFKSKGIGDYLKSQLEELKCEALGKNFVLNDLSVDVAISFANAQDNSVKAYTNGLYNADGGEHVKAVMDALAKSLKPYKSKKDVYKPSDLQDGLVGLINAKLAAPSFSNQKKDKLLDDRIYEPVFQQVFKAFEAFWKANKSLAKKIIQRASELRKKTSDFLNDKKLIKNIKNASKKMSDKLADINNSKTPVEERELYLVEGDSAAGPCKKARDNSFQAVFSLRGKVLNVMDAPKAKINNNAEVSGILAGIGLGSDSKRPSDIRYGKIIFLADGDIDGKHINTLLLTLFWKFLPNLFKEGRIYILVAPEYYTWHKKKLYFGATKKAIYKQIGTESKSIEVKHLKGHGEASVEMLEQYAFNTDQRKLLRISYPKSKEDKIKFEKMMGKKADYRQEILGVAR